MQFVAPPDLAGEVGIGMAIETDQGTNDRVGPLLQGGATPLEVFLHLAPQGTEAPDELVEDHLIATEFEGRTAEVRDYSGLRSTCATIRATQTAIETKAWNRLSRLWRRCRRCR